MSEYGGMMKLGLSIVGGFALAGSVAIGAVVYNAKSNNLTLEFNNAKTEMLDTKDNNVSWGGLEQHLYKSSQEYFKQNSYECTVKPEPKTFSKEWAIDTITFNDGSSCKPTPKPSTSKS